MIHIIICEIQSSPGIKFDKLYYNCKSHIDISCPDFARILNSAINDKLVHVKSLKYFVYS